MLRWQGDRDSRDPALTAQYESNLVALIKQLRLRYKAPNAPFVAASLGQSTLPASKCEGNCGGGILQAELNIADATKYPEFKGTVTSVDTLPMCFDPKQAPGGRDPYKGNAKTYLQIGESFSKAMLDLIMKESK